MAQQLMTYELVDSAGRKVVVDPGTQMRIVSTDLTLVSRHEFNPEVHANADAVPEYWLTRFTVATR